MFEMIDKSLVGTFITVLTILGTFTYNQGSTSFKIEALQNEVVSSEKKIISNREKVQEVQIDIAKIESKIDEGFKRIEDLLFEK